MCGIVGIIDPEHRPIESEVVTRFVRTIRHRGPDDEGIYVGTGVGLGACRLSIIDLSSAGHQPMLDPVTGVCVVHNGEIYNHPEVISALGLSMEGSCDTEVILRSYAKLGENCLNHFNGIFAFAVWDPHRKRLMAARDRLGVKPLYYAWLGGRLCFASEIKALLDIGVPAKPNLRAIYSYLAYGAYDHSSETFFEGVQQVPPGHVLTFEKGRLAISRYWDIRQLETEQMPYAGAVDRFHDLVTDALRLQLRSDVPVAVHVSGGLDSSLMLAAINEVNGGQGSLMAFSYYYGEEPYDERPYVEELVSSLGWQAEYHRLSADEVPALAETAMWFQESPYPGIVTLAKHKLIEASRPFGATVVLEGQGGDEIGAGYQYYLGPHVLDLVQRGRVDEATRETALFAERNGIDMAMAVAKLLGGLGSYYNLGTSADGTPFVRLDCLDSSFVAEYRSEIQLPSPFNSHLLNVQYRDIFHTKLPRILRSCDRASMQHSRELRVPLLDHRLVEFALTLPADAKFRDGNQRAFMRDALRRFPLGRLSELPKRAVVDPQREWLRGPLAEWGDDILRSSSLARRGILDEGSVLREWERYRHDPAPRNSFHVWQWLSLELWFRTFIDSNAPTPDRREASLLP